MRNVGLKTDNLKVNSAHFFIVDAVVKYIFMLSVICRCVEADIKYSNAALP